MEYRIERLSRENIRHLVPLYADVFHRSVSLAFLLAKYNTQSVGVEFVGYVAFTEDNNPAGYYGVIPCYFQLQERVIVAAQSADTMTHPQHRKKGLFQLLATHTYDLARKLKIEFIFGFPNQNSLPGFVKLNWQFLPDQLQVFTLNVKTLSFGGLIRRSALLSSWYGRFLDGLGRRHTGGLSIAIPVADGVLHDHNFFAYKTYNTTHVVLVQDVKIWMKADGKLKVGAVQGLDHSNVMQFLTQLKKLSLRLGCREVIFMTSRHSLLHGTLCDLLSPRDAFPIGFLSLQNEALSFKNVLFEYCDVDIF